MNDEGEKSLAVVSPQVTDMKKRRDLSNKHDRINSDYSHDQNDPGELAIREWLRDLTESVAWEADGVEQRDKEFALSLVKTFQLPGCCWNMEQKALVLDLVENSRQARDISAAEREALVVVVVINERWIEFRTRAGLLMERVDSSRFLDSFGGQDELSAIWIVSRVADHSVARNSGNLDLDDTALALDEQMTLGDNQRTALEVIVWSCANADQANRFKRAYREWHLEPQGARKSESKQTADRQQVCVELKSNDKTDTANGRPAQTAGSTHLPSDALEKSICVQRQTRKLANGAPGKTLTGQQRIIENRAELEACKLRSQLSERAERRKRQLFETISKSSISASRISSAPVSANETDVDLADASGEQIGGSVADGHRDEQTRTPHGSRLAPGSIVLGQSSQRPADGWRRAAGRMLSASSNKIRGLKDEVAKLNQSLVSAALKQTEPFATAINHRPAAGVCTQGASRASFTSLPTIGQSPSRPAASGSRVGAQPKSILKKSVSRRGELPGTERDMRPLKPALRVVGRAKVEQEFVPDVLPNAAANRGENSRLGKAGGELKPQREAFEQGADSCKLISAPDSRARRSDLSFTTKHAMYNSTSSRSRQRRPALLLNGGSSAAPTKVTSAASPEADHSIEHRVALGLFQQRKKSEFDPSSLRRLPRACASGLSLPGSADTPLRLDAFAADLSSRTPGKASSNRRSVISSMDNSSSLRARSLASERSADQSMVTGPEAGGLISPKHDSSINATRIESMWVGGRGEPIGSTEVNSLVAKQFEQRAMEPQERPECVTKQQPLFSPTDLIRPELPDNQKATIMVRHRHRQDVEGADLMTQIHRQQTELRLQRELQYQQMARIVGRRQQLAALASANIIYHQQQPQFIQQTKTSMGDPRVLLGSKYRQVAHVCSQTNTPVLLVDRQSALDVFCTAVPQQEPRTMPLMVSPILASNRPLEQPAHKNKFRCPKHATFGASVRKTVMFLLNHINKELKNLAPHSSPSSQPQTKAISNDPIKALKRGLGVEQNKSPSRDDNFAHALEAHNLDSDGESGAHHASPSSSSSESSTICFTVASQKMPRLKSNLGQATAWTPFSSTSDSSSSDVEREAGSPSCSTSSISSNICIANGYNEGSRVERCQQSLSNRKLASDGRKISSGRGRKSVTFSTKLTSIL